jgi:hypothetical protein
VIRVFGRAEFFDRAGAGVRSGRASDLAISASHGLCAVERLAKFWMLAPFKAGLIFSLAATAMYFPPLQTLAATNLRWKSSGFRFPVHERPTHLDRRMPRQLGAYVP